jgi:glycosyltransferase involved in cell wall biosynthesis
MDKENKWSHKILCISVMQNKGGGEEFLLNLCKNVKEYDFVIVSPEGEATEHFRKNDIKTITVNSLRKIYKGSGWNLYSLLRIILNIKVSTFRLSKILMKEKPGLILANGLFAALYLLPSALLAGKRFIVVQHLIFDEKSVERLVLKMVHWYVEKIVCVSYAVKENVLLMMKKSGSPKIIVIPNGINVPFNKTISQISDGEVRIGIVGSLIRIKGIHIIIEALKGILKGTNVSLFIFGSVSGDEDSVKYRSELAELIKKYGIGDKVFFKGHVESKDNIYSSLDIVVNFSLIPEAFPFSVLEGMAYKKIVIAVGAGGPKEMITDRETGFLVGSDNVEQLKEKIEFCLVNLRSESLAQIRTKAFEQVMNHYSIERFAVNYSNLFNSIIKS